MIFLGNLNKITDQKYEIGLIHYMPFDNKNGLNKPKEQLEKEGILVDNVLKPQQIEGKNSIMYWNPTKKEIFYEYENIKSAYDDKKEKDTIIKNLSQTVAKISIEVNKLKGDVK